MKTWRLFVAVAIVLSPVGLSGCGGYPMTVESRTPASTHHEMTLEDKIRIQRQFARSRDH